MARTIANNMATTTANIRRLILIVSTGLVFSACNFAFASTDENIDQLQKKLIEIRTTVDEKSEELSLLRQENKQKRKFMLSQISEMKSSIDHNKLRLSKIDSKLSKNRQALSLIQSDEVLEKELAQAIDELSLYVSKSLPFKRKSRLDALQEMNEQLSSKAVSAPRLANKLWAFVEDEMTLIKGNGIYRQIIKLDNEEKLVDVARVGMMMLYFRDGTGNVGMAERREADCDNCDTWQFVSLNSEDQIHQIHFLFDSFQKQVRFGEFTLPNALSGLAVERAL